MMQMTKRAVVDLLYCFVTTKKDQSRERQLVLRLESSGTKPVSDFNNDYFIFQMKEDY